MSHVTQPVLRSQVWIELKSGTSRKQQARISAPDTLLWSIVRVDDSKRCRVAPLAVIAGAARSAARSML